MTIFLGILRAIYQTYMEMAPYLLIGLTFAGILYVFFKKSFVEQHIGSSSFGSIIKASLLGIPLPLCSCGVIPTSIALYKNGASKSSTISFLISTPQTGIDSIAATYGMLGPIYAIFRPIAAFFMGIIGGLAVKFIKLDDKEYINDDIDSDDDEDLYTEQKDLIGFKGFLKKIRIMASYGYATFLDDITSRLIFGIIIAGLLTYLIPDNFFDKIGKGLSGMLIMLLAGIPMYICATASIPIAVALIIKGISPGAAFVFLAAGPATNAASITLLFKIIGKKTTFLYLGVIAIMSIGFGYLLDILFTLLGKAPMINIGNQSTGSFILFKNILAFIFLGMLLMSIYRIYIKIYINKLFNKKINIEKKPLLYTEIFVKGMTCSHCVANVEKAVKSIQGVKNVSIDLKTGKAIIKGKADLDKIKVAVDKIGYKVL